MVIPMILQVLTFLLPAIVLFFIARMVVWAYLRNESLKREAELKIGNREVILPLRLQAYERLILLLERMSPQQSVSRNLQQGMSALQFQIILTQSIREEYEHNAAQQVYISSQGWAFIKSSKEEVIRLINTASAETDSNGSANELAQLIISKSSEWDKNPIQSAIEQLKAEVIELY